MSISGSVRHPWPFSFQYAFQASGSGVVGGCRVDACLPSSSLIPVSLFLKYCHILTEEIIFYILWTWRVINRTTVAFQRVLRQSCNVSKPFRFASGSSLTVI